MSRRLSGLHTSPRFFTCYFHSRIISSLLFGTYVSSRSICPMDSSRGTTSYRGHDRYHGNHHVDDSPQNLPSSVHMLDENVPVHDQPGLTDSRRYSDLERTGSSPRGLDTINHDCPWQPGRSRRTLYLGYAPLLLSLACKYIISSVFVYTCAN